MDLYKVCIGRGAIGAHGQLDIAVVFGHAMACPNKTMVAGVSAWAGAALREVLIPIGSAIFAAGLAFFLVETFARERHTAR